MRPIVAVAQTPKVKKRLALQVPRRVRARARARVRVRVRVSVSWREREGGTKRQARQKRNAGRAEEQNPWQ